MTKLQKLKDDVKKIEIKISELESKKKELKDKVRLEEQDLIQKLLKENIMNYEDLLQLIPKFKT